MTNKNFQQSDKMTERELLILKMRFGRVTFSIINLLKHGVRKVAETLSL